MSVCGPGPADGPERLHRRLQQDFVSRLARPRRVAIEIGAVRGESERDGGRQFIDGRDRAFLVDAEAPDHDGDARRPLEFSAFHDRSRVDVGGPRAVRADAREDAEMRSLDEPPVRRGRQTNAERLRNLDDEGVGGAASAAAHDLDAARGFDLIAAGDARGAPACAAAGEPTTGGGWGGDGGGAGAGSMRATANGSPLVAAARCQRAYAPMPKAIAPMPMAPRDSAGPILTAETATPELSPGVRSPRRASSARSSLLGRGVSRPRITPSGRRHCRRVGVAGRAEFSSLAGCASTLFRRRENVHLEGFPRYNEKSQVAPSESAAEERLASVSRCFARKSVL